MDGVLAVQEWLRSRFLKAELVIFCLSRMFLKMEDSSKAEQKHFVAFSNIL